MRGKKGLVFHIAMVIVTLIILTRIYVVIQDDRDKLERSLGEEQFVIYTTLQDIETSNNDMGYAAQDALRQAVIAQARSGGKYHSLCGSSAGFNYWKKGDTDCYPDTLHDLRKHFLRFYSNDYHAPTINLVDKGSYTLVSGYTEEDYKASINKNTFIEEK